MNSLIAIQTGSEAALCEALAAKSDSGLLPEQRTFLERFSKELRKQAWVSPGAIRRLVHNANHKGAAYMSEVAECFNLLAEFSAHKDWWRSAAQMIDPPNPLLRVAAALEKAFGS